jgi:hypothetical protein
MKRAIVVAALAAIVTMVSGSVFAAETRVSATAAASYIEKSCPGGSPAELAITVIGVDDRHLVFVEGPMSQAAALARRHAIHVDGLDLPEQDTIAPFYPAHRVIYMEIRVIC